MSKQIDLVVIKTKEKLLNTLNNAGLPITILSLILADVFNMVKAQEESTLRLLEAQAQNKEELKPNAKNENATPKGK